MLDAVRTAACRSPSPGRVGACPRRLHDSHDRARRGRRSPLLRLPPLQRHRRRRGRVDDRSSGCIAAAPWCVDRACGRRCVAPTLSGPQPEPPQPSIRKRVVGPERSRLRTVAATRDESATGAAASRRSANASTGADVASSHCTSSTATISGPSRINSGKPTRGLEPVDPFITSRPEEFARVRWSGAFPLKQTSARLLGVSEFERCSLGPRRVKAAYRVDNRTTVYGVSIVKRGKRRHGLDRFGRRARYSTRHARLSRAFWI